MAEISFVVVSPTDTRHSGEIRNPVSTGEADRLQRAEATFVAGCLAA
jgi:hypothetical protein